ncbi:hypothetical protein [Arsenicicoccus bolidensis]|uniref:hypothetical protein n=1 Tax=Arsenicicoccus bolidensis TaxID=229480 RepID=UPI0028B135D5|nr:hypothetical protein [Arsenicicoccus bolidensis]
MEQHHVEAAAARAGRDAQILELWEQGQMKAEMGRTVGMTAQGVGYALRRLGQ